MGDNRAGKDTHSYADDIAGADLALVREGLVIGPIHDTRVERVVGDVLDSATNRKGTA